MKDAAMFCVVIVVAIGVVAFVWTRAAATPKPQIHRPQIWCFDQKQVEEGIGWPLCDQKLYNA